MMQIKVLGQGCDRCNQLHRDIINCLAEMDVAADLEKVEDIKKIMAYKVVGVPALIINNRVKATGRVPSKAELQKWIREEL